MTGMFFADGVSSADRAYGDPMGEGDMLPGMAEDPKEPLPDHASDDTDSPSVAREDGGPQIVPVAGQHVRSAQDQSAPRGAASDPAAPASTRTLDIRDRRDRTINTVPELGQHGRWSARRLDDDLFLAEAMGRPIGLITARVIVSELLHDQGYPVGGDLTDHCWSRRHAVLVEFARSGSLPDPTLVSDAFASFADVVDEPLGFAARLIALDAFLDHVPAGPHAWVHAPTRSRGWVSLEGTDADLARRLGVSVHAKERLDHRVLGLTGLGGLTLADVVTHWVAGHVRAVEGTERIDDLDETLAEQAAASCDVWACWQLAQGRLRHGPAYAAYARSRFHLVTCSFEECYRGPVESVAGFCFGIGMRDGWWLEHEATVARLGLGGLADLDTEQMWDLYAQLGWSMHWDDRGELHLFAPPDHVGPPPSVGEARAELEALERAQRIGRRRSDADEPWDHDPEGWASPGDGGSPGDGDSPDDGDRPGGWGPPRFTDPPF